jgi:hypothetical protein
MVIKFALMLGLEMDMKQLALKLAHLLVQLKWITSQQVKPLHLHKNGCSHFKHSQNVASSEKRSVVCT